MTGIYTLRSCIHRTAKLPIEMELTDGNDIHVNEPYGNDKHVNEPECDYSDMHKKVAKMIELKHHLLSKAKYNIDSAQARYKRDYDRKREQSKVFIMHAAEYNNYRIAKFSRPEVFAIFIQTRKIYARIYPRNFFHLEMVLYKYFKKAEPMSEMLPSPDNPLSVHVLSSTIVQANKEVKPLLQPSRTSRRGHYYAFSETEKAEISKRASEFGVTSTVRYFNKKFTDRELKESTVRTWANQYRKELATRKKEGKDMTVVKLVSKKSPLMLGEELDKQV